MGDAEVVSYVRPVYQPIILVGLIKDIISAYKICGCFGGGCMQELWLFHPWQPPDSAEVRSARRKTCFLSLHLSCLVSVLDLCAAVK